MNPCSQRLSSKSIGKIYFVRIVNDVSGRKGLLERLECLTGQAIPYGTVNPLPAAFSGPAVPSTT
jgi:hypothetical protein